MEDKKSYKKWKNKTFYCRNCKEEGHKTKDCTEF